MNVAARAGVSVMTASNGATHPERLAAATLERVRRAAAELDYSPDAVARHMAGRCSTSIGLVLDLALPQHHAIYVDIEAAALAACIQVQVGDSESRADKEQDYLRIFADALSGAVIVCRGNVDMHGALDFGHLVDLGGGAVERAFSGRDRVIAINAVNGFVGHGR